MGRELNCLPMKKFLGLRWNSRHLTQIVMGKDMWGKNGVLKKTALSGMDGINNSVMSFAITVAVLAATITLGPVLLKMFHVQGEEVLGFTALLGLFTLAMGKIFIYIQKSIKAITEMDGPKGAKALF